LVIQKNQTKAKVLIERALDNSADEERYLRRLKSNPKLADLGCVPDSLNEIANNQQPWFCHGLAFRMATYSDSSDDLFNRWEGLLAGAETAEGWTNEYVEWRQPNDHWAKRWDRFYQFLWLLQCYEYLSECGHTVSFPLSGTEPKPDLLVVRADGSQMFVECYFYTKWWAHEHFIEDLLGAIDRNLIVKRTHNIGFTPKDNPMSGNSCDPFVKMLAELEESSTQENLDVLRAAAGYTSPQLVRNIGAFSVWIEGSGKYQPSHNAHGARSDSWPIFEKEIINAKSNSNGLRAHHPNLVMVNGLGLDFQHSFDGRNQDAVLPPSLDEIFIFNCGIDDKIENCNPFKLPGGNTTE
jgi:hypothetical protein